MRKKLELANNEILSNPTKDGVNNVGDVRGGVVGQEEGVVGWELEDVARCEAGEDEPGDQFGICDSEAVTANQADVLVHSGPRHRTQHVARHQI